MIAARRLMAAAAVIGAAALSLPLMSGCGSASAETVPSPATAAPAAAPSALAVVQPGERLAAPAGLPPTVRRALGSGRTVVVAFLLPGPADDRAVARAIDQVKGDPDFRGSVRYVTYEVGPRASFGNLAEQLGVEGTPTVAVIGADLRLLNRWGDPIDATILRRALTEASLGALPGP